jgi:hypothetical protein
MSTVFLIIVLVALFHFVYESIWAPTVRVQLQGELFSLRKVLHQAERMKDKKQYAKQFHYLDDATKNLVGGIHRAEIVSVIQAVADVEKDKELKASLEAKVQSLDKCDSEEIKKIWGKTHDLAVKVLRTNSGGWLVYIVTIAIFLVCLTKLHEIAKSLVSLPSAYLEEHSSGSGPISVGA